MNTERQIEGGCHTSRSNNRNLSRETCTTRGITKGPLILLLLLQLVATTGTGTGTSSHQLQETSGDHLLFPQCTAPVKATPPSGIETYKVGGFGIRGAEQAYEDYNITFQDYLTGMVGHAMFDPPIQFQLVPIFNSKEGFLDFLAQGNVDFMFMHTGAHSCIESEVGTRSLATVVSRRVVNGEVFELNGYGGVIFTSADNDSIYTLEDIRNRTTACVAITAFGSGQVQFRDLIRQGIHHIQDVSQVIFMEKQPNVVNAVIRGEVDVGYVRTDQLERTIDDETGELVDLTKIRVIRPQIGLLDDGVPFPFPSTSRLYPEWSFSAFPQVSNSVARAVKSEIMSMEHHAAIVPALLECYERNGCEIFPSYKDYHSARTTCHDDCFRQLDASLFQNCADTTPYKAHFAHEAMLKGRISGWSPSASYMEVRNMQEDLGFLQFSSEDGVRCIRTTELSDAVSCPPGHFKKSDEDIQNGCQDAGLDCYGFQCLCSPCVKAFDVDFFPVHSDDVGNKTSNKAGSGCAKFQQCGVVEQNDFVTLRAIDNRRRENVNFSLSILSGNREDLFLMQPRPGVPFEYELVYKAKDILAGEHIVVVTVDGVQIPESPFRILVQQPDCKETTGDPNRVSDEIGFCVCGSSSVEIFSGCVPLSIVLVAILVPLLGIVALGSFLYADRKRRAADAIWKVNPDELRYDHPPRVLGRGTYGLVLLAHYRGTNVAVKRVLPPKEKDANAPNKVTGHFDFDDDDEEGADDIERQSKNSASHTTNTTDGTGSESGSISLLRSFRESASGLWQFDGRRGSSLFSSGAKDYRRMEREFISEMRLLSRLRHPCITTTMGAVLIKNTEPQMVMEIMEMGSLYDLLHNDSIVLDGDILLPILRDIARGLRFLHAATPQIVHCDLKAANVLVDSRFHAKVADFGLSRKRLFRNRAAGTPFWMAPELLRGESSNTTQSDVYSFGVVLYEVVSRNEPYKGQSAREVLKLVADPLVNKRPGVPVGASPESAELIRACVREKPNERPSAEEISIRLDMLDPSRIVVATAQRHGSQALRSSKSKGGHNSAEDLLTQLFPQHIANALREGRKVEPEQHDSVTVYFSDIVNYTEISSTLSPTKVSDMLDRLYTKFDELSELHNVFKVETVGDAYMTVTNIAEKQPHHCEIMAEFAIDCLQAASTTLIDEDDPSRGYVQIRSGFHSGPVVAHVVGNRNPRYSIIGDTVNTAARMESNSKPGRIQCSEVSAELLKHAMGLVIKCRGEVQIKGKGDMTLYWVKKAPTGSELMGAGTNIEDDESVTPEQKPGMTMTPRALEPISETQTSSEFSVGNASASTTGASSQTSGRGRRRPPPRPEQQQHYMTSQTIWTKTAEDNKDDS